MHSVQCVRKHKVKISYFQFKKVIKKESLKVVISFSNMPPNQLWIFILSLDQRKHLSVLRTKKGSHLSLSQYSKI